MQKEQKEFIVLDIGGTLTKMSVISSTVFQGPSQHKLTMKLNGKNFYFNFFKLIEDCYQYLRTYFSANDAFRKIIVTGGGAYKYEEKLSALAKQLNKQFEIIQEFQSLLKGLKFFKQNLDFKEFIVSSFDYQSRQTITHETSFSELLAQPMLVVNIGSGVSILLIKTDQNGEFSATRVGGTALGGGFFLGLANLLVGENNFHTLLEMASKGTIKNTDIIPSDFPQITGKLSEAAVLVSLGKLKQTCKKEDIVRSLFYMTTFNIAQIALENSDCFSVNNVIFTGFYCRDNSFFLECFAQAFTFFRKQSNVKKVFSMRHDGYLGTLGVAQIELTNDLLKK